MADTFTWVPDDGLGGNIKHDINKVQFGDGYAQRSPIGFNAKSQDWALKFDRPQSEIAAIEAFIDAHAGISFFWTPPKVGAVPLYFTCEQYNTNIRSSGQATLTARFEQSFQP